ncbi:MAG: c-type cytochrome [Dongiaceae bacterium]
MPRRSPRKKLKDRIRPRLKEGAAWFGIFIAAMIVGGFLFTWSGLYSVAATSGHWPGFGLFLEFGMRSSVRTHTIGIAVPPLHDAALIERGAGHFQEGCMPCHGAPGRAPNPIAHETLPEAPDLVASVPTWEPEELFWIIKQGLKYTGMPGWAAQQRDDEIWAVVAFLRQLPALDAGEYQALASLDVRDQAVSDEVLAQSGPPGVGLATCSRCHGLDGQARASGAYPRLDIQTSEYLFAQLAAYDDGTRQSGIMAPIVAEFDEAELRQLADYYAASGVAAADDADAASESESDPAVLEIGRALVIEGLPDEGIPACISCHGDNPAARSPLYPALAGQHASYIAQQLMLFRSGARRATPAAEIMAVIAERLTPAQIDAVSAYLSGLQPGAMSETAP